MDLKALILAGGYGTRLRSLISDVPKSMADVNNKPFLEYQISILKKYRFTDIIVCTGYMAEKIENHFGNGHKWDVNITYSHEDTPLGTAGAIRKAEPYLTDTFLASNGDTFFDFDLTELLVFHRAKNAVVSIAAARISGGSKGGVICMEEDGRITHFIEKDHAFNNGIVSAGIYVMDKCLLNYIPPCKSISFEKETLPMLIQKKFRLYAKVIDGMFIDIGTPKGYRKLQNYLSNRSSSVSSITTEYMV